MDTQRPSRDLDGTFILRESEIQDLIRPVEERTSESPFTMKSGFGAKLRKIFQKPFCEEKLGEFAKISDSLPNPLPPVVSRNANENKTGKSAMFQSPTASRNKKFTILTAGDPNFPETCVNLHSSLDFLDGQTLMEEVETLMGQKRLRWVLGLTELIYCDSTTLGFLMMMQIYIRRLGGNVIAKVREKSPVHQIILQSRIDRLLPIEFG